jgi:hypothetical protein
VKRRFDGAPFQRLLPVPCSVPYPNGEVIFSTQTSPGKPFAIKKDAKSDAKSGQKQPDDAI